MFKQTSTHRVFSDLLAGDFFSFLLFRVSDRVFSSRPFTLFRNGNYVRNHKVATKRTDTHTHWRCRNVQPNGGRKWKNKKKYRSSFGSLSSVWCWMWRLDNAIVCNPIAGGREYYAPFRLWAVVEWRNVAISWDTRRFAPCMKWMDWTTVAPVKPSLSIFTAFCVGTNGRERDGERGL